MNNKISTALIRREADVYRSHGLHREARELYTRFLSCGGQVDPGTESTIHRQIRLIELEMDGGPGAAEELSGAQIEVIKAGWRGSASEEDLLQSARTLMEIGRPADALKEFGKMIFRGSAFEPLSPLITQCFTRLFDPETLPGRAARYARVLLREGASALQFQMSMAEEMLRSGKSGHATALCRHLRAGGPGIIEFRLNALEKKLKASQS
jgi:hypothetical protein